MSRESRFAHRLLDQIQFKCVHCEALVVRAQLEDHKRTCAVSITRTEQIPHYSQEHASLVTIKGESVEYTQKEHNDAIKADMLCKTSKIEPGDDVFD